MAFRPTEGWGNLDSPLGHHHPRNSVNSSFSFGARPLIRGYMDANNSMFSDALDPNRSILAASPLRYSPLVHKRRPRPSVNNASTSRHPLATDTTDVFQEDYEPDEDEEEPEWTMVDRMRLWRHDAMMQHLYETAAFWGDKILSWTNDPNDTFWLAQTYFHMHQYSRAERLLTRPFRINSKSDKGKDVRLPMGPGAMIEVPEELQDSVSRLVDMSVACRYLAAQCHVRQGNWEEAKEMLGDSNPFSGTARSGPLIPNVDGGIKIEAAMCHLRGVLMQKLNRADKAKQCFMEALSLDVKCYDAFEQLISGEMLTPEEEWEFIQHLSYGAQTPNDAAFIQLIYTSRLRKYNHQGEQALTRKRLVEDYGLSDNPDVLFSFADALYTSFKWADCYVITSRILSLVSVHDATLPLHIACMYYLGHLHSKLFMLAHEMVEREPENAISWYAVGVWYLAGKKWGQARQYFSKTSLMDPRFAPAWIAFAHTFALEGEHDHAVIAYSTSARMFTGSHLPLTFIGMEQIMLSNHTLADEALNAAYSMCNSDPLLLNELGVMAYNRGEYDKAATFFTKAVDLAAVTQSSQKTWSTTYINLGTCYRKLKQYGFAKANYEKVVEMDYRHPVALGLLGMVHHLMGEVDQAVVRYHEALGVDPINQSILELLGMALETLSHRQVTYKPNGNKVMKALATLKEKGTLGGKKGKEKDREDSMMYNEPSEMMSLG